MWNRRASIAILISGNGSNLQAIIDAISNKQINGYIACVISNNESAYGLERAKAANIKNIIVDHKNFPSREGFDKALLKKIEDKGVKIAYVTLHIGLGTFKPIMVEDLTRHQMDSEYFNVPPETATIINEARERKKNIITVGTSTVRTLETVVVSGFQITAKKGWTDKFVYPPYEFKMCDRLITNFHQPQSTLMMMVSAFSNKDFVMRAYQEAIDKKYRFYSYGDAMICI